MKNIYRWGLMRNTRSENLSEHSLETAMIAHALAVINKRRLGGTADPDKTATAAMFHDTSEIITGDMPTPVKYNNSDIISAYKQIEKNAEERLLNMLPEDFREDFKEIYSPDADTKRLVNAPRSLIWATGSLPWRKRRKGKRYKNSAARRLTFLWKNLCRASACRLTNRIKERLI